MSTIKSSAENLTLNADGANNDVIIQSNGSTKVTVDGAKGNVGVGVTPETDWNSSFRAVQLGDGASIYGGVGWRETQISTNARATLGSALNGYKYIATDKTSTYQQYDGNHNFRVAASGSADAAITWTTGLEVLNAGQARAKNGLLFGTDTAAANTLDDYEEGTWTLGLGNVTAHGTCTFVSTYTKIGKVVTVSSHQTAGQISRTSTGGYLTGLPFAPSTNSSGVGAIFDGSPTQNIILGIFSANTNLYLTGTYAQDNLFLSATYMTDS